MTHPIRTALHGTADIYGGVNPSQSVRVFTDPGKVYADLAAEFKGREILACEVGSWAGLSAIRFCQAFHRGHIVCVDTWLGSSEHWLDRENPRHDLKMKNGRPDIYSEFLSTAANFKDQITPLPQSSSVAAQILAQLGVLFDMIYIDGDHSYEGACADIKAYLPLLKDGGVMLGDDYGDPRFEVAEAVTASLTMQHINMPETAKENPCKKPEIIDGNWWLWRK